MTSNITYLEVSLLTIPIPGHGVHEFSLEDVDNKQVLKASKLGFEEIEKRIAELVGDLGWTYVKESILKEIPARFPGQQRPF